jgi:hypothetical protein
MEPLLKSKILFALIFFFIFSFVIYKCTQDGSKYLDNYIKGNEKTIDSTKIDSKEETKKNTEKQVALKNDLLELLSNVYKSKQDYKEIIDFLEEKLFKENIESDLLNSIKEKYDRLDESFSEKLKRLEERIKNSAL